MIRATGPVTERSGMVEQGPVPGGQEAAPRRRRSALAAALVAAAAGLGAAATTGVLYVRASQAERAATDEARRAVAVAEFLQQMLAAPQAGAERMTVRELIEQASARAAGEL